MMFMIVLSIVNILYTYQMLHLMCEKLFFHKFFYACVKFGRHFVYIPNATYIFLYNTWPEFDN